MFWIIFFPKYSRSSSQNNLSEYCNLCAAVGTHYEKKKQLLLFFCGILVKIFRLVRISLWFFLTDLLGSLCGKRWTKLLLWVSKNFIANKVAVLSTLLLQKYIYHSLRTFSVNPSEVKSFAIAKNLHKVKPSFMRHSLYPLFWSLRKNIF